MSSYKQSDDLLFRAATGLNDWDCGCHLYLTDYMQVSDGRSPPVINLSNESGCFRTIGKDLGFRAARTIAQQRMKRYDNSTCGVQEAAGGGTGC